MSFWNSEKMSAKWYDIKAELEGLIESLESFPSDDADTFSTIEGIRSQLLDLKAVAVQKLITALKEEN